VAKRKASPAPKYLAAATRKWFDSVLEEYVLEPHHVRLLTLAAEAWDRCQQARAALAKGLTFKDVNGHPRARPEVAIERDSRIAFARLIRELALDVEPPADDSRPPTIAGNAGLKMHRGA
jgi:hypothetical protein